MSPFERGEWGIILLELFELFTVFLLALALFCFLTLSDGVEELDLVLLQGTKLIRYEILNVRTLVKGKRGGRTQFILFFPFLLLCYLMRGSGQSSDEERGHTLFAASF